MTEHVKFKLKKCKVIGKSLSRFRVKSIRGYFRTVFMIFQSSKKTPRKVEITSELLWIWVRLTRTESMTNRRRRLNTKLLFGCSYIRWLWRGKILLRNSYDINKMRTLNVRGGWDCSKRFIIFFCFKGCASRNIYDPRNISLSKL